MSIFSSLVTYALRDVCEEFEIPELVTEILVLGAEILLDDDD